MFHFLLANVLIVSRFGQKRLLNALNVNVKSLFTASNCIKISSIEAKWSGMPRMNYSSKMN